MEKDPLDIQHIHLKKEGGGKGEEPNGGADRKRGRSIIRKRVATRRYRISDSANLNKKTKAVRERRQFALIAQREDATGVEQLVPKPKDFNDGWGGKQTVRRNSDRLCSWLQVKGGDGKGIDSRGWGVGGEGGGGGVWHILREKESLADTVKNFFSLIPGPQGERGIRNKKTPTLQETRMTDRRDRLQTENGGHSRGAS